MPTLADTIRSKLDAGVLPREDHIKLWAGFGSGWPCVGCGRTILPAQVEHELEFADGRMMKMHIACAGLYEAERRRRGWSRPPRGLRGVRKFWQWRRDMKTSPTVADILREKIAAGDLPREDYFRLRIDYGRGRRCAVCEQPILRSQVEHEMGFANGQVLSMHFSCVELYEAARRRRR
jgi:hypothetical protein